MSNALSLMVAASLIDNRFGVATATMERLTKTMTIYPQHVLQYLANANVRVVPLTRGITYSQASPALKRMGVDVDAWPAPPAGLFVVEERSLYLRSLSTMTVIHEMGHACDLALGSGLYRSSFDDNLRKIFNECKAYVTPYQATGLDEFVAEGIRAFLSANSEESFWPKVSRERLKTICPELDAWIEAAFAEMEAAVAKMPPLHGADDCAGPAPEPQRRKTTRKPKAKPLAQAA